MATPTLVTKATLDVTGPMRSIELTILPSIAGDCLVLVVEGVHSANPYSIVDFASHTPVPSVTDNQGNVWTLAASAVNVGTTPVAPFYEAVPDLSGMYPSLYVFMCPNAIAGTSKVFVNVQRRAANVTSVAYATGAPGILTVVTP